jgi:hypothetical protein
MGVIVEFNESAFRHGISKEDILHAYRNRICDTNIGEFSEKYAVIGPNRTGNLLEILYYPIDDDTISIFHAMEARDSFIKKLGL